VCFLHAMHVVINIHAVICVHMYTHVHMFIHACIFMNIDTHMYTFNSHGMYIATITQQVFFRSQSDDRSIARGTLPLLLLALLQLFQKQSRSIVMRTQKLSVLFTTVCRSYMFSMCVYFEVVLRMTPVLFSTLLDMEGLYLLIINSHLRSQTALFLSLSLLSLSLPPPLPLECTYCLFPTITENNLKVKTFQQLLS
jgi:hypothetical protein